MCLCIYSVSDAMEVPQRSIDATGLQSITKNLQTELSVRVAICREETSVNLEV